MELDIRYANHPDDAKYYTTDEIREHFLIEDVFVQDQIKFTYSHQDRIIAGGVMPVNKELALEAGKEMGADFFLFARELGAINVGGPGIIVLDGEEHEIKSRDGIYVGKGIKDVVFKSVDSSNPAKFYVNSATAHKEYPTVKIEFDKANPVKLGNPETMNVRTIYQYVHPAVCESCQLTMGMTILEPQSAWNTMPSHTHERRMEVYFYFDMKEDQRVFHMMGQPNETRHIIMANEQAVISPSWSIHSGVGTSNYSFIWGMCGENKIFTDMDHLSMDELR
ncbi:4-deoxy-L-threo-5-hexulose uronate isomerase [Natranaerovirga pectinivora]|uniref:4-deoxy-L-threo-5-hexosulose-uronate ketol-isomerase n=1 Tax=Natranaerovirga pectinivora TaxID=682400 RepID=A0A4R3MLT4_9FIRM|nr:5-dehydro-4-deoxy-D-glucuronate isomerase [Natranaerovirga pectinivora]TCT13831.1 4-deoxy-L-threo-5-hexulose uronate isomerase [Natranaerovirga pectinivora]